MYGITTFLVMPLCLLKDVSKLRIASLFGIITLMFLIVVIVIQCPFYIQHYWDKVYKENDESTHMNLFNVASGFDEHLFFFQGTAAMFYSFTCHIGAFPIFNSLKNNVNRRIQKVINRTILLDFLIFIIIIVCGFLTWPVNTPELIIERENIAGGKDIIMGIGKIAFIAVMIVKLPSCYNSFRISFYELIFKNTEITTAK
jgi:amino acid permease